MSVQKALRDSMAGWPRRCGWVAPWGELNESLQRWIDLLMRFFLAFGGPVDALSIDKSMESSMAVPETLDMDTDGGTSIFDMGRG